MVDNQFALPEGLMPFVQDRVAEGGYESVSAYLAELVNSDRRQQAKARLEAELLRRIDDPVRITMDDADWAAIRQQAEQRIKSRNAS